MVRRSTRRTAPEPDRPENVPADSEQEYVKPKEVKPSRKKIKVEPVYTTADYLEISIPDPTIACAVVAEEGKKAKKTSKDTSTRPKKPIVDRALRTTMRHVHLLALLLSEQIRSRRCNEPLLQALVLSVAPQNVSGHFGQPDDRTLVNALSFLANWWKNNFGMRMHTPGSSTDDHSSRHDRTIQYYRTVLRQKQGYEEDLALLACALLRAIGVESRLVSSLQPIPIIPPALQESDGSFTFIPTSWVEAFHRQEACWVPVDFSRAIVNCRQSMEVGNANGKGKGNTKMVQHTMVIATDSNGIMTDVTRRYSSRYYSHTWKFRQADEPHLQAYLEKLNTERTPSTVHDEEAELEAFTAAEPIPDTLSAFHLHGKYVLGSKLKKYETFHPPNQTVGSFRSSDPIHLRSSVKKVRSKEAWYTQFARSLKEGEQPVKVIQLPKKKKKGIVGPDEDPYEPGAMQPLYGEWQTVPYIPPVAVDGKVPRNAHGNVDLFQPEMLPIGCSYIPYPKVWRSAKELGVDYADACVRFAFHGRMAVPNLQGIVVCREDEAKVLHHYFKKVEEDLAASHEEVERQELLRRRREALSVKIASRLQAEYVTEEPASSTGDAPSAVIQSAFSDPEQNSDHEDFSFD